jgi:hypothetical protein
MFINMLVKIAPVVGQSMIGWLANGKPHNSAVVVRVHQVGEREYCVTTQDGHEYDVIVK